MFKANQVSKGEVIFKKGDKKGDKLIFL